MYFSALYNKYNRVSLTIEEVSSEIGLSVRTIRRLIADDDFPVGTVGRGRKHMFLLKSLCEYLESLDELAA